MVSARILIVEDNEDKFKDVESKLVKRFKADKLAAPSITRAISRTGAVQRLAEAYVDIVILDLKIPLVDNGMPEFRGSATFLDYLRRQPDNRPFRVVGLTSYGAEEYIDEHPTDPTVTVHHYNASAAEWLDSIINEIKYVLSAKVGLQRYFSEQYDLDVLFLVARYENEYQPILSSIDWLMEPSADRRLGIHSNTFGVIRVTKGVTLRVGIVCVQDTGLSVAAAMTSSLIALLRPKYLFMLGMCCGLNDDPSPYKALLGDVIVAVQTDCWDEGKYSEEIKREDPFYVRSLTRTPNNEFRQRMLAFLETRGAALRSSMADRAKAVFDLNGIAKACGEPLTEAPNAYFGLMLSGSSVVDSVKQISTIRQRFPAAIALEMEAHAIYSATDLTVGATPSTLVIKGVADHGQGKKNTAAQPLASVLSYVVALAFLGYLHDNGAEPAERTPRVRKQVRSPSATA